MAKEEKIELQGQVEECLPGTKFLVKLAGQDNTITATLSGKMKINRIRILPADYVTVELSPYDLTKGRITYRHKSKPESYAEESTPEETDSNDSSVDTSADKKSDTSDSAADTKTSSKD